MIGIIILNYVTDRETIKLVEQLQQQSVAKQLRICIVDNASPNGSFDRLVKLKEQFDNVVAVLQTGENIGYAKGNNWGLKYFEENNTPKYIAVLNNDIILSDDCFEKLIGRYEILERPAFIAPTQTDPMGKKMFLGQLKGFGIDLLKMFVVFRAIFSLFKIKPIDNTGHNAMITDVIPGSMLFISFNKFKQIGYFYPNTFLFYEEFFLAAKVLELGYVNYTLLDESYIHDHSTTINTFFNQRAKCKMRYDCLVEFTSRHRRHGKFKAHLLSLLVGWSLFEISIVTFIRSILQPRQK